MLQQQIQIQQQLQTMPEDWRQSLQDASKRLSSRRVLQVLDAVPSENTLLKEEIIALVHNFRYDLILQMLDHQGTSY